MPMSFVRRARGALPAALLAVVLAAVAAAAGGPVGPDDVRGPLTWGAAHHVTAVSRLYFADQPDRAGFEAAREAGVGVVVNLRAPEELDWDERAAVEELGMAYYDVPVRGGEPFSAAAFQQVEEIVDRHGSDEILVHCSSSNRAGAWLAWHLVRTHGMSVGDALAVARKAGVTKPKVEQAVRRLLAEETR